MSSNRIIKVLPKVTEVPVPETVPEVPDTVPEVPDTVPEVPDVTETVLEVPDTVPEVPDTFTVTDIPETVPLETNSTTTSVSENRPDPAIVSNNSRLRIQRVRRDLEYSRQFVDHSDNDDDNDDDNDETKVVITGDENNYVKFVKRSPTLDFDFIELLGKLVKLVNNIFKLNTDQYDQQTIYDGIELGHNVHYSIREGMKTVIISMIIFEVEFLSCQGIVITEVDATKPLYSVSLKCLMGLSRDRNHSSTSNITVHGSSITETFNRSFDRIRSIKYCYSCDTSFDSSLSDVCICCLFSDIYTKDNPTSVCAICKESTKDFKTLYCGHRFDYNCLSQMHKQVCPICREPFKLT
jgi:hypothetical protein